MMRWVGLIKIADRLTHRIPYKSMPLPIPFDVPRLIEIWKMQTQRESEMAQSKRARTSIIVPQNQTDRLSDLPDCLIHHILSFMETKKAAQTCLLSRRWLNLWTCVPILDFGLSSSSSLSKTAFKKFVRRVLTRRRDSRLQSLVFHHSCSDSAFTKTVFRHARLRGVQEIDTNDALIFKHFPRCQSLRVLKLRAFNLPAHFALDFACLTTLHLDHLVFCPSHILPNLHNMHTMCLTYCYLKLPSDIKLTVPKLTNLVVSNVYTCLPHTLVLSVPLLSDFNFEGHNPRGFCLADCSYLDKANIVLTHLVYSELLMGELGQSLEEFMRPLVPTAKSLVLEAPHWKVRSIEFVAIWLGMLLKCIYFLEVLNFMKRSYFAFFSMEDSMIICCSLQCSTISFWSAFVS